MCKKSVPSSNSMKPAIRKRFSNKVLASASSALSRRLMAGCDTLSSSAARVSVPFTLSGTLDSPQFAMAGTPQLIGGPSSGQAAQLLPTTTPTVQDLMKLIPGL